MALFHLHLGSIGSGSSSGSSSVCAYAAYISGSRIEADRTGKVYDFTKKEVTESFIMLPQNAPERFTDRSVLWNEVEKVESSKGKNSSFAKFLDAALPRELSVEEDLQVMKAFGAFFTDQGMIVDMALHYSEHNPHIHAIMTTRKLDDSGNWEKYKEKKVFALDQEGNRIPIIDPATGEQKVDSRNRLQWKRVRVQETGWNRKEFLQDIRKEFETVVNDELERKGSYDRVDCRSYADQGIAKLPMIHEGKKAREMEARGEISDVCQYNREVTAINMAANRLHDLIENVSSGIMMLKEKIAAAKLEVRQELIDAFRGISMQADNLIEANKADFDDEKKDAVDGADIYSDDEDPVDRDDWWDPV